MTPTENTFSVEVGPRLPGMRLRNGDSDGLYYVRGVFGRSIWFGPFTTLKEAGDLARSLLEQVEFGTDGAIYEYMEVGKRYWLEKPRKWYVRPERLGRNASGYMQSLVEPDPEDPTPPVYGCMDADAYNYEPNATAENGSCLYDGCTDKRAVNYDARATRNDGSCRYKGCTDKTANNFSPLATEDDGSCVFSTPPITPPISPNAPSVWGKIYSKETGVSGGRAAFDNTDKVRFYDPVIKGDADGHIQPDSNNVFLYPTVGYGGFIKGEVLNTNFMARGYPVLGDRDTGFQSIAGEAIYTLDISVEQGDIYYPVFNRFHNPAVVNPSNGDLDSQLYAIGAVCYLTNIVAHYEIAKPIYVSAGTLTDVIVHTKPQAVTMTQRGREDKETGTYDLPFDVLDSVEKVVVAGQWISGYDYSRIDIERPDFKIEVPFGWATVTPFQAGASLPEIPEDAVKFTRLAWYSFDYCTSSIVGYNQNRYDLYALKSYEGVPSAISHVQFMGAVQGVTKPYGHLDDKLDYPMPENGSDGDYDAVTIAIIGDVKPVSEFADYTTRQVLEIDAPAQYITVDTYCVTKGSQADQSYYIFDNSADARSATMNVPSAAILLEGRAVCKYTLRVKTDVAVSEETALLDMGSMCLPNTVSKKPSFQFAPNLDPGKWWVSQKFLHNYAPGIDGSFDAGPDGMNKPSKSEYYEYGPAFVVGGIGSSGIQVLRAEYPKAFGHSTVSLEAAGYTDNGSGDNVNTKTCQLTTVIGQAVRTFKPFEYDSSFDYAYPSAAMYSWDIDLYGRTDGSSETPKPPRFGVIPPQPVKPTPSYYKGQARLWIVEKGSEGTITYDNNAVLDGLLQFTGSKHWKVVLDDGRDAYLGIGAQLPWLEIYGDKNPSGEGVKKIGLKGDAYFPPLGFTIPKNRGALIGFNEKVQIGKGIDFTYDGVAVEVNAYRTGKPKFAEAYTLAWINSDDSVGYTGGGAPGVVHNPYPAILGVSILFDGGCVIPKTFNQKLALGPVKGGETDKLGTFTLDTTDGPQQVTFYRKPQRKG